MFRMLTAGAGAQVSDKVSMALDWRQTVFYPIIAKIYAPTLGFGGDAATIPEGIKGMVEKVEPMLAFFLDGKPFIGGDSPSIARDWAPSAPNTLGGGRGDGVAGGAGGQYIYL